MHVGPNMKPERPRRRRWWSNIRWELVLAALPYAWPCCTVPIIPIDQDVHGAS